MAERDRLVVGVSGASGVIYAIRALDALRAMRIETHLVVSRAGALTLSQETDLSLADLGAKADVVHKVGDVGASIASGSFKTLGMLIAPCSVRTMSEIASGVTSSLMSRAADVTLKEGRRLVLMVRETPLQMGHLRTMANVSEMGAVVMPPVPAFYHKPKSIDDIVNQTVGRALDLFGFDLGIVKRWGEEPEEGADDRPVRRFRKG
jgi:4-hydroxy-3-polyprenylbenzoate decarboxylase